jgi:methionine-rich copper-binding protein CopC
MRIFNFRHRERRVAIQTKINPDCRVATLPAMTLALFLAILPATVFAHAFLDEASPKVGSDGNPPPDALRLKFTQGVEPDFSHVTLTLGDAPVAVAAPVGDPQDNTVLVVKPQAKLAPGTYKVAWAVVSVDTHHTTGSYSFTVAP